MSVCLFVPKDLLRTDMIFPYKEASHRSIECLLFCGRVLPPSQEKSSLEKSLSTKKKFRIKSRGSTTTYPKLPSFPQVPLEA